MALNAIKCILTRDREICDTKEEVAMCPQRQRLVGCSPKPRNATRSWINKDGWSPQGALVTP